MTPETVLATLAKGVNHTDMPRRPIPELGWSMGLWSGGPDDECYSIDFHCGAYSDYVGNRVVMDLPSAGPLCIDASPERALKAYETLVEIWSPDLEPRADRGRRRGLRARRDPDRGGD